MGGGSPDAAVIPSSSEAKAPTEATLDTVLTELRSRVDLQIENIRGQSDRAGVMLTLLVAAVTSIALVARTSFPANPLVVVPTEALFGAAAVLAALIHWGGEISYGPSSADVAGAIHADVRDLKWGLVEPYLDSARDNRELLEGRRKWMAASMILMSLGVAALIIAAAIN